tara:strand:+ start:2886 stop:3812 length:927 start_codon:yes stop_codon:yes gene_type:complete
MKKVFYINGGAGRVLCSIPAFLKRKKLHGDDFYIVSESGIELFIGVEELQDVAFDPSHKDIWERIVRPNDLVTVEPYRQHGYYNQELSLSEAFDKIINETDDHSDLEKPKIVLNQQEEITGLDAVTRCKEFHKKQKTVIFQPFGRSSQIHEKSGHAWDSSGRSLTTNDYFYISEKIRSKYNCIVMTEHKFENDKNMYCDANMRAWCAIIEAADYFLGVDSVGQHIAYSFGKPGTVIMGSTFAKNVSYPDYFNIVEKKNIKRKYSPIRIDGLDGELINRINDKCMYFTKKELDEVASSIMTNIKKTIGA